MSLKLEADTIRFTTQKVMQMETGPLMHRLKCNVWEGKEDLMQLPLTMMSQLTDLGSSEWLSIQYNDNGRISSTGI